MIEILEGNHEIINFRNSMGIRLFYNDENEDYPEHWHTAVEIIMPKENKYKVIVEKKEYILDEGDIFIINSGVLHSLKAPEYGERIILQFSDYLLYSLKGMETLFNLLPNYIYLSEKNDSERIYSFVKKQMDAIAVEYDQEKTFFEAAIYARIIEIFVFLGRNAIWGRKANIVVVDNDPLKKKEYMDTIMKSCKFINENFTRAITLEETAEVTGFSKFHFSRIFKQCMNMTFYEYLNNRRVSKAEELLGRTDMSISFSPGFKNFVISTSNVE